MVHNQKHEIGKQCIQIFLDANNHILIAVSYLITRASDLNNGALIAYNALALLLQYFTPNFLLSNSHPTKTRYCWDSTDVAHTTWPTLSSLPIPVTATTMPL